MSKWNEPSQLRVSGSDFVPVCQCCMSTVDLVLVPIGISELKMWLCPECIDAHYQFVGELATFICPTHGDQQLDKMSRYFKGIELYNKRHNKKSRGIEYKLYGEWSKKIDWNKELESLRESYKQERLF